jgi:hypothetical protein
MNEFDETPYSLPKELLDDVWKAEAELRRSIEHVEGRYLVHREVHILRFESKKGIVVLQASDVLQFLRPLVRSVTHDSAESSPRPAPRVSFASAAGRKLRDFIELTFYGLRERICKKDKKRVSANTTIAVASLAHWLLQSFGMQEEYAKSTATAILVAILCATKGAFCKMTEKDAKAALERLA